MTANEQVYEFFVKNSSQSFYTSEIIENLPEVSKASIYFTLSTFAIKEPKILKRVNDPGSRLFKYSLIPGAKLPETRSRKKAIPECKVEIFWTDYEKLNVSQEYNKLINDNPDMTEDQRLIAMQINLPKERKILEVSKLKDHAWKVTIHISQLDTQTVQRLLESVKPMSSEDTAQEDTDPEDTAPDTQTPLENVSLDSLVNEISRRISVSIKDAIISALSSEDVQTALKMRTDINVHHTSEPTRSVIREDKRPKIIVIGLRKDHHMTEIQRDYSHINISFFDERAIQDIRKQIQNIKSQMVYFVADNVNYRHSNTLRTSGVDYVRVEGIGQLRYKLTEDFEKFKFI